MRPSTAAAFPLFSSLASTAHGAPAPLDRRVPIVPMVGEPTASEVDSEKQQHFDIDPLLEIISGLSDGMRGGTSPSSQDLKGQGLSQDTSGSTASQGSSDVESDFKSSGSTDASSPGINLPGMTPGQVVRWTNDGLFVCQTPSSEIDFDDQAELMFLIRNRPAGGNDQVFPGMCNEQSYGTAKSTFCNVRPVGSQSIKADAEVWARTYGDISEHCYGNGRLGGMTTPSATGGATVSMGRSEAP